MWGLKLLSNWTEWVKQDSGYASEAVYQSWTYIDRTLIYFSRWCYEELNLTTLHPYSNPSVCKDRELMLGQLAHRWLIIHSDGVVSNILYSC